MNQPELTQEQWDEAMRRAIKAVNWEAAAKETSEALAPFLPNDEAS